MLKLLTESVTSRHGERLEQIVIVLIGIEIRTYQYFFPSLPPSMLLLYGSRCVSYICAPFFSTLDPLVHIQTNRPTILAF